uniref:Uncharacterized protein n=1 Tax=Magallana gigas TaxID=29159 RepID=K1Q858_MAGGI
MIPWLNRVLGYQTVTLAFFRDELPEFENLLIAMETGQGIERKTRVEYDINQAFSIQFSIKPFTKFFSVSVTT